MKFEDLKFCEEFEKKYKSLELLLLIKDNLTEKGRKEYFELKTYILNNLDKYMELTN